MNTLTVKPSECSCQRCSSMCHAPCCGTTEDMEKLIEAGYGNRLMLDDLPGGNDMLKPALRGYEGQKAPWNVASEKGCTFWKDGLCELHSLGLKPAQGKLAHHGLNSDQTDEIADYVDASWADDKAIQIIEKWKEINP